MRIVYIGAERVGLACLCRLIDMNREMAGVFTADPALGPKIADYVSFDDEMARRALTCFKIKSSKAPEFVQQVKALRPDLILVIGWSQIIPQELVHAAPLGCVGLHYSLLPARRGGAPLFWALRDGLTESGMTLFYLNEKIDAGDVIAQKRFPIDRHDTARTLLDKIVVAAPELLSETIHLIESGKAPRIKQDESRATTTTRRTPSESLIQGSYSLEELHNFIRALAPPYPSAFTFLGGHKLVIPSARLEKGRLWIEGYLE